MEENAERYSVAEVKGLLKDFRQSERDIDNQIERLERLTAKMQDAGISVVSDMPKAPSFATDRMSDMIGQKVELEESIREEIETQSERRKCIEKVLNRIKVSDERGVIRMRYFDCESWGGVAEMLFGVKDDYEDRKDSYLRRVHKLHGSALCDMVRELNELANVSTPFQQDWNKAFQTEEALRQALT